MKVQEIRDIILEAYAEVLSEQGVPTTMDELLARFPPLYRAVKDLLTKDYRNFVSNVEWVSPKPSTFRVLLNNQQAFYLKWMGKGFQAQVEGKKYDIENVAEFQQALSRVAELLKHSEPISDTEELDGVAGGGDSFDGATTGGSAPSFGGSAGAGGGGVEAEFAGEEPVGGAEGEEEAPSFEEPAA